MDGNSSIIGVLAWEEVMTFNGYQSRTHVWQNYMRDFVPAMQGKRFLLLSLLHLLLIIRVRTEDGNRPLEFHCARRPPVPSPYRNSYCQQRQFGVCEHDRSVVTYTLAYLFHSRAQSPAFMLLVCLYQRKFVFVRYRLNLRCFCITSLYKHVSIRIQF